MKTSVAVALLSLWMVGCGDEPEVGGNVEGISEQIPPSAPEMKWTDPTELSLDNDPGARYPAAIMDEQGHSLIAWQQDGSPTNRPSGGDKLYVQRHVVGKGWEPPLLVDDDCANGLRPSLAKDSSGRVFVAWRGQGEVLRMRRLPSMSEATFNLNDTGADVAVPGSTGAYISTPIPIFANPEGTKAALGEYRARDGKVDYCGIMVVDYDDADGSATYQRLSLGDPLNMLPRWSVVGVGAGTVEVATVSTTLQLRVHSLDFTSPPAGASFAPLLTAGFPQGVFGLNSAFKLWVKDGTRHVVWNYNGSAYLGWVEGGAVQSTGAFLSSEIGGGVSSVTLSGREGDDSILFLWRDVVSSGNPTPGPTRFSKSRLYSRTYQLTAKTWVDQAHLIREHQGGIGAPAVAYEGGERILLWSEDSGADTFADDPQTVHSARYGPDGLGWTSPELIGATGHRNVSRMSVAVNGSGRGIAVWDQRDIDQPLDWNSLGYENTWHEAFRLFASFFE